MTSSPTLQRTPLPVWKRLLFTIIVVATLLIVPEAILRWTSVGPTLFPEAFADRYASEKGMWRLLVPDPVLYWRGRPFARVSNEDGFLNDRGFRGNSFRNEKPSNMQRVVCMGDSSTFGMVHHGGMNFSFSPTYSSELETLLNAGKSVQDTQVINAGVIGYSTLQGLRLLKHEVRHWQPDVITIRYGVNDHLRIDPNYTPAQEPRNAIVRWVEDTLLGTHSYQLLVRLKSAPALAAARTAPSQAAAGSSGAPGLVPIRVPLADFEYNLRRLVIEGRAVGARIVLMTAPLAPDSPEISNRTRLWIMGYTSYDDLAARHQLYDDAVRRVASDLDVPLLDSSRQFAERGLEKFFTKFDFAHPTGDGHIAIAQDLAALIRSKWLLWK